MAEQIGLEAVFDLSSFNKGIGGYTKSLSGATKDTERAAGSMGKAWNDLGKNVAGVAKTMAVGIAAAGVAAGAAIAGFTASGIKKAADLEAQLSSIAATLNMTAEQVAPLNDLILELGLDPKLKVSATEAADAIENLARNGLSMTEILDGAARSTVLLANATGADFGTAADIATDAMSLFDIEAKDMATAVDGITGVTNASKFTINDYRLALSQAGGVAAATGVSFADFNATITAISPAFASGSDAGTSFKTMLQRLIPQSKEAHGVMTDLGLITTDWDKAAAALNLTLDGTQNTSNQVFEAFRDIQMTQTSGKITTDELNEAWAGFIANFDDSVFFDAAGNMEDMNTVAIELNGALAGLTEEQKLNAVTILAGADASRAMLGLMESGTVVYTDAAKAAKELGVSQEEVNKVIEGGITQFEALALQLGSIDAAQQAATRMDNFKGSLEILQGTIETLQIRIGQAFLPLLQKITEWATEWIAANGPAIAAAFEKFAASVSAVIDVFTHFAEEGELLSATEFGLSEDTAKLVDQFVELSIAVGTTLRDAFKFVQEHADAFKGVLIGIGTVLAAATITSGITAIVTALGTLLTPIGLVILAAAGLGFVWNTNWLGMRDKTIAIIDEIKEAFTPLTTAIEEFGSGALTEIQDFVTGNETEFTNLKAIWDGAKETFTNVSTGIQESATSFVTYLKEQFPQLTPVIDGFSSAISLVVEQVKEQFTLLQDATSAMISLVTSLIDGDWATAWQSAKDLAGAFVTYVEESFVNVKTTFEDTFGAINPVVTGALTEIQNFVAGNETEFTNLKTIWDGAKTSFNEAFDDISTWFSANWPGIKSTLEEWGVDFGTITDAIDLLKEAWDLFVAAFNTAVDKVETAWQGLVDLFGPSIDRLIESFETFVTEITELGTEFSELQTAASDAFRKIQNAFSDLWTVVKPIVDALIVGLGKIAVAIGAALGFVAILAINLFASTFENMGEIVKTVVDQVTAVIETIGTVIDELVTGVKALADGDWKTAWDSLKDAATAVIDLLTTSITNLKTLVETLGTTIYDAIVNSLDDAGILTEVQQFVRAISDTLSTFIDWAFVGRNIIAFVRNGISSAVDLVTSAISTLTIEAAKVWTTVVSWAGIGVNIITFLINGIGSMLQNLVNEAIRLATDAAAGFVDFDWKATGKAIIEGIKKGLEENGQQIIDFLVALGRAALNDIRSFFGLPPAGDGASGSSVGSSSVMEGVGQGIIDGWLNGMSGNSVSDRFGEISEDAFGTLTDFWIMKSPSRLMGRVGRDIIEGWLIGMRSMENKLFASIQHVSDGVAKIAGSAGANAIGAYTSALSSFSSVAGSLLDRIGSGGPSWVSQLIGDEQRTLAFLQEQADLIEAIRASGADPADVLSGVTLGPNADPVRLAQIVGFTMTNLNHQLMISLQNAASGLDREIENARTRRENLADVEERLAERDIDTRSMYARRLASIDEQIAQAEEDAIRTGNRNVLLRIQNLDHQRNAIIKEFEMLLAQQKQLEDILTRQPVSDNQRGQAAIERWRKTMIDPLIQHFDLLPAAMRAARLQEVDRNMRLIQGFAAQLPSIAGAEARLMQALEGFGTGARNRAEQLLNLVYDPRMASVAAGRAQAVHDFANALINLRGELQRMSDRRLTKEDMMERIFGSFDQLTAYQNALDAVDRQIAGMEAHIMETGNVAGLNSIRSLDAVRAQRQAELENFLRQTKALENIMRQVKNFSGPGQAAAERFFQEHIQSIADAFSFPMRSVERDAWIKTAHMRVDMINRFVEQMRQLERVQNRVAGNQNFAHLADEFAQLQDILMPETTRGSLINQLNSYITQMMRLHQIQQDISAGRGINPIVERFASERLDAVARQLENINLTEAERNRLIEQYRVEQEKILRLQEKQQQLDFINQQLALIKQLRDLDDKEDWAVNVENILSGISFGVNASIDDLMLLTGKVLDELVRFANHELGIASPSKVFAKVGTNIMAGLESGILAGMRQPMNALRSAAGNLIPYSLSQRALTINMGGVTINDGIDAVMFEAKIRQIVRSEFAA